MLASGVLPNAVRQNHLCLGNKSDTVSDTSSARGMPLQLQSDGGMAVRAQILLKQVSKYIDK
jgi:hypothetical protein